MKVNDLAAIVTGGGTGIGFATAKLLRDKRAKVKIPGCRQDISESAGQEIGALAISCDISNKKSIKAAFKQARETQGTVRFLVNSAAVSPENRSIVDEAEPVSLSWFTDLFAINFQECSIQHVWQRLKCKKRTYWTTNHVVSLIMFPFMT